MKARFAREIAARYRWAGPWTRMHVQVRVRSCPFEALLERLPSRGLVASLGCGHGAFELLAAMEGTEREVLGTDIDPRKVAIAQRAAKEGPPYGCAFHNGDFFDVLAQRPEPPAAIVIVDTLAYIPKSEHGSVLLRMTRALAPGGCLLVKEMDPALRLKAAWNAAQEALACRVLRITLSPGSFLNHSTRDEWEERLVLAGLIGVRFTRLDRGFPHPHLLVEARKPCAAEPSA